MEALKILEIGKYNSYVLEEIHSKKRYNLILEFYGIKNPEVGDSIIINSKLLDPKFEGYCQPYAFESCKKSLSEFGEETEYIVLHSKNEDIVLQRVYG